MSKLIPALPPVNSRAKVARVPSVCDFLHGVAGVVTEHRFSPTQGAMVAVLTFDEPVTRHWIDKPLTLIGLKEDQLVREGTG